MIARLRFPSHFWTSEVGDAIISLRADKAWRWKRNRTGELGETL